MTLEASLHGYTTGADTAHNSSMRKSMFKFKDRMYRIWLHDQNGEGSIDRVKEKIKMMKSQPS